MTEAAKKTGDAADAAVTEIIELVSVIDWRWVILAGVLGAVSVFAILALIEHSPDAPSIPTLDED